MSNRALGVLVCVALMGLAGSALTRAQGQRSAVAAALFTVSDADKDGALTRAELKAILDKWSAAWEGAPAALCVTDGDPRPDGDYALSWIRGLDSRWSSTISASSSPRRARSRS
jgi:hypothetical protein